MCVLHASAHMMCSFVQDFHQLSQDTREILTSLRFGQRITAANSVFTSCSKWLLIHISPVCEPGLPACPVVCCLSAWLRDVRSEREALMPPDSRSNTSQAAAKMTNSQNRTWSQHNYQCLLNLWNVLSKPRVNVSAWLSISSEARIGIILH